MINGFKGKSIKFLGLTPLEETLESLSTNLNKFALVGNNIKSITNLALGTKGQNLIDSGLDIKNTVTGVTTLDAQSTNSMSQPLIYSSIETKDYLTIKNEFDDIGMLSIELDSAMTEASKLANNNEQVSLSKATLDVVVKMIQNITLSFSDWMYGIINLMSNMNKEKTAYMIALLVFIVFIVIVYIGMVYVVYQQNVKQACHKMRLFCKILLAFIILLTLLITLITLFIYAFNLAIGTICNVSDEFIKTKDFTPYFNTDDSLLASLANNCLGSDAKGDIFAVIKVDAFTGLKEMLKGITNYNFKIEDINSRSNNSATLAPISSSINDVLSGNAYSHASV
jgi:hypothetical protein